MKSLLRHRPTPLPGLPQGPRPVRSFGHGCQRATRLRLLQCGRGEALVTAEPGGLKAAPGRRPRPASGDHRAALRMVALATVVHILRSRRFYRRVITVAIALGAIRQIGQENQASTMARLAAWDKRQVQRLERKAKRQGQVIRGAGQMMRSGAPRHLTTRDGA